MLLNKIKSLVLGILGLISKLLCCIRKRRRSSDLGIDVNNLNSPSKFINDDTGATNWDNDDWDSCEIVIDKQNVPDAPNPTPDPITAYRQHLVTTRQNSAKEDTAPDTDLFSDMAPHIKIQQKLFIGKESPSQSINRLQAQNIDPMMTLGTELGNWEDQDTGWDPEDDDLINVLKQQKRNKR